MTDLVKRLRQNITNGWPDDVDLQACNEAADRIEALEKTLRLAAGYISAQVNHWQDKNPHDVLAWLHEVASEDIRAALAGEKKDV